MGVDPYARDIGIGRCDKARPFWECTEWDYEAAGGPRRALTKEAKDALAFVQDGEDYKAELLTLGGFGCNQFEGMDNAR
jgi:hypothetical protein